MVIWGQTVLPPMTADADANYAFLRDVARWAGARLTTDSDQPLFWLNLLAGRDGKSWFGLVHVGQWQGVPNAPASGPVRWLALPDGEYHIKELVHQRDLGRFSGEALRTTGLPVTLGPREVAIYQISSVAK
jgi:catechol 2,3-dioxygenase-like lactoylglutathione lyase family enzyme